MGAFFKIISNKFRILSILAFYYSAPCPSEGAGIAGYYMMQIRKAEKTDIPQIISIEKESLSLWKEDFFYNELENKKGTFIVAVKDTTVTGYIIAWIVLDEVQILSIAVTGGEKRKKIATALVNTVYETASLKGGKKIFIEVDENNLEAISFYKNNGYIVNGIRKEYYGSNNALLMEKTIKNEDK